MRPVHHHEHVANSMHQACHTSGASDACQSPQGVSEELNAPEAVSGEPSVELQEALVFEGLHSAVHRALVWVGAIRLLLHLLNASLDKVKGQTACRRAEPSNQGTP